MNETANFLGEQYRQKSFIPDKYGNDFGCYSTFDTEKSFKQINISTKNKKHFKNIKKMINIIVYNNTKDMLLKYPEDIDNNVQYIKEAIAYDRFYYSKKLDLYLAWHWDGDGTLIFIDKNNKIVVNTDCKKDYYWNFKG